MYLSGKRRFRVFSLLALAVAVFVFGATSVLAGNGGGKSSERALNSDAEGAFEALEASDQYGEARTSPADVVDAGAFSQGYAQYKTMPVAAGTWNEITTMPYDSDAHNYRDPVFSNSGGGSQHVGGRMTSLAVDGSTLYAGGADGGVWKKVGNGAWQPLTDDAPTLSTGSLLVDPAHHLWVGTGEANTNSDSYSGIGVLYSPDGGATFSRVGGDELNNHTIGRLVYDNGSVLAATSRGLYRHSATTTAGAWTAVLKEGVGLPAACAQSGGAANTAFVSDVAVKPNTGGNVVDAVVGWRAGSNCNGFFESTNGGQTFSQIKISGAINDGDLGRVSIAWSADGKKAYAVVQSAGMFNHARTDQGGTILQGIYESAGSFGGSWNKIAEWRKLANSGSALKAGKGYHPGVQAWYNQFVSVDPANSSHVFVGLEEVFETKDGGSSWTTAAPYWNFGLPCASGPQGLDGCPPTAHSDQHAVAIANGTVYVGNDGGVYSRGLNSSSPFLAQNDGLNTLQYYYADSGPVAGGDAYWGGLQDNGESLLLPGAATQVSPFGGDGGDTYVDHTNGNKAIVEYTDLDMALTTNGGQSDGSALAFHEMTPSCFAFTYTPSPCDPTPRFIAPFESDPANPTHWIAGGQYVWDNQNKGWNTSCSSSACDWKIVADSGAGNSVTQVAIQNGTWYAAWCGPCNSAGFGRGILTNAGGTVHALSLPTDGSFPNRFIQGLTIDPSNPNHVYVVFSSFSRHWTGTFSAGEGHVYESSNGGGTWTDISGNLPDIPGDDLVVTPSGKLVVASDIGVMVSNSLHGGSWSRLGSNLPNVSVNDLTLRGSYILAATHGRGLWKIATP